jgi:hypothetical protein
MSVSAVLMLLVSLTGLFATRNAIQTPNQSWEKVWLASIALFFGVALCNHVG